MIESVIIENYKSIQRLELSLEQINLFIGGNGAGKSNFLSFFQLARSIYEGRLKPYSTRYGAFNLLFKGLKHQAHLSGALNIDHEQAYAFSLIPGIIDESLHVLEESFYFREDRSSANFRTWTEYALTTGQTSPVPTSANLVKAHIQALRLYHFHDTSEESPMRQACLVDDNACLRENGSNLAAYLYWIQERHPSHLRRIERVVQSVAPFIKRFDLKPSKLDASRIRLTWEESDTDQYMDAVLLSDGTLRFIALATLLLQPDPPKVILIDEPELGLHPKAISKLAGLLHKVSACSQIIVTTQSVDLINAFAPENVVTVDRGSDGSSIFNRLDAGTLNNWLKTFSLGDIWQKSVIGGQP